MNTLKTFLLMFCLTLIFLWIGDALGGQQGMVMALIMALVMNFGVYWFSDKIVLMMYRAKEAKENDYPQIYHLVKNLVISQNIPMPKIYIINQDVPNAFATGRDPQHAALAVTEGILEVLNDQELEGVVAHELSHIKHRDILIATIAATLAGAITILARMAGWALMFGGMGGRDRNERGGGGMGVLLMMILAPIAAMLVQLAISRSREYLADEGSAKMTRHPLSLANALRKLDLGAQRMPMNANPVTSHLFIVNPLRGGGVANLFFTHPPVEKRIQKLEELEKNIKFNMPGMPKIIS